MDNDTSATSTESTAAIHKSWIARDGARFELRQIEATDCPLLVSFARRLSYRTRYFRYGRGTFELDESELRRMCEPDPAHSSIHLIVLFHGSAGHRAIVGSGRLVYEPGHKCSELTLTVSDSWQRRGVGRRLLECLIEAARSVGHHEIVARILATNRPMFALVQRRGFAVEDSSEGAAVKVARLVL